jgi:hypothetical protein
VSDFLFKEKSTNQDFCRQATDPSKHSYTAKEEKKALSLDRLGAFRKEPQMDGNRNIMLPDQTQCLKEAEAKAKRQMSAAIKDIMQSF